MKSKMGELRRCTACSAPPSRCCALLVCLSAGPAAPRAKRGVIHSSRKGNVNALAFGENDEAGCRDQVAMLPKQEAFASKISAEIEESGARSTTP